MKINILAVGKLKERYWADAQNEYVKRISRFAKVDVVEIPEEKAPENASEAQEQQVRKAEAERFYKNYPKSAWVVALDLTGESPDSPALAVMLNRWMLSGKSEIVFCIGGSTGLDRELVQKADARLCLSKLTFPHQMARIVLLEQVYRAFKILGNETYHK